MGSEMCIRDRRTVNSIPPRMLIKAGSVLIVPRRSASQRDVSDHVADHGQLSLAPEIITRRTVVKAGRRDTVASVAHRYKLNPAQVAEWNHLSASAAFKPGQQVVLHLPLRSIARAAAPVRVPGRAVVRTSTRAPEPARAQARPAPRKAVAEKPAAKKSTAAKAPATKKKQG